MNTEAWLKYPAVFAVAFVVTWLLTPLFIRLAPKLRLVDTPTGRHRHRAPVPRGGGVAVFLGFHAACAFLFMFPLAQFAGQSDATWWHRFLLASFLVVCLGLADDRWRLPPLAKLGGQIALGLVAFALGMRMTSIFGIQLLPGWNCLFTVLWLAAIMNAFNLIDGLDGLATGLTLIGCIGLGTSFFLRRLPGDVLVMLALAGACMAFLRFNFHPARVFLGDAGSLFLGFCIASMALTTESKGPAATAIVVPLFAAGVPLFDAVLAVWRRTVRHALRANGAEQSVSAVADIAEGDTDHLHHRLVGSGLSDSRAAVILYSLSGLMVAVGVLLVVFRSHTLGILLAAFVFGTYIAIRHLAKVELWDTGVAILNGLARPPSRMYTVLVYPVVDVVVLAGASAAVLGLLQGYHPGMAVRVVWLKEVAIWSGLPFIALAFSRTYERVWGRARASEYAILGAALVGGILLAGGVFMLVSPCAPRELAVRLLLLVGMTAPVIVGSRAVGQSVQDAMAWVRRYHRVGKPARRAVLYGAGYPSLLFLRSLAHYVQQADGMEIVGFFDDDVNLHGRYVFGYRVLGGGDQITRFVREHRISDIILFGGPTAPVQPLSEARAAELGVRLMVWNARLEPAGDRRGAECEDEKGIA